MKHFFVLFARFFHLPIIAFTFQPPTDFLRRSDDYTTCPAPIDPHVASIRNFFLNDLITSDLPRMHLHPDASPPHAGIRLGSAIVMIPTNALWEWLLMECSDHPSEEAWEHTICKSITGLCYG